MSKVRKARGRARRSAVFGLAAISQPASKANRNCLQRSCSHLVDIQPRPHPSPPPTIRRQPLAQIEQRSKSGPKRWESSQTTTTTDQTGCTAIFLLTLGSWGRGSWANWSQRKAESLNIHGGEGTAEAFGWIGSHQNTHFLFF